MKLGAEVGIVAHMALADNRDLLLVISFVDELNKQREGQCRKMAYLSSAQFARRRGHVRGWKLILPRHDRDRLRPAQGSCRNSNQALFPAQRTATYALWKAVSAKSVDRARTSAPRGLGAGHVP